VTTTPQYQTFSTTPQNQFLRGTTFTSVAEAIQSGKRTHDQWYAVVEAYQALERKVQARERRLNLNLENATRLDGARYQVIKALGTGPKTYPDLPCSSIHKAVKALRDAGFISATGNLCARKNRAQLNLTDTGKRLLEQYNNSPKLLDHLN
jgi:hypothetical protein